MSNQLYFEDVEVGQALPVLVKNCSSRQLVMWAGASGDYAQIHYDLGFAQRVGLDSIVVHGALKHAFLGQQLHDWIAPAGRIERFSCQYRGIDYPDQDITCSGVVTRKLVEGDRHIVDLDVWTQNPQGRKTTPGTARIILPTREQV